jgi:hypothetical protein
MEIKQWLDLPWPLTLHTIQWNVHGLTLISRGCMNKAETAGDLMRFGLYSLKRVRNLRMSVQIFPVFKQWMGSNVISTIEIVTHQISWLFPMVTSCDKTRWRGLNW